MIEKLITSRYLYPVWRIGWLERAFFHVFRLFYGVRRAAFLTLNFGFDISKYQGIVDFLKMLAYGARFLILRCGYNITRDERFEENIAGAYGVLPLSVYHFYDPVFSPVEQANKVIAILAPHKNKIRRVWLDFEFWWSGSYSDPKHWKTYRDTIKTAGHKVGIYTRATWWDSRVGTYAAEFAKDPVWAAQYNTTLTLIPKGWTRSMVWQDKTPAIGKLAGVSSLEIDHDLWNDEFDFDAEWGPALFPPEPGDPMAELEGTVVWDAGANERTGPSASYPNVKNSTGAIVVYPKGTPIKGIAIVADQNDPTNLKKEWMQIAPGRFVATKYPNFLGNLWIRVDYHEVTESPADTFPHELFIRVGSEERKYVLIS